MIAFKIDFKLISITQRSSQEDNTDPVRSGLENMNRILQRRYSILNVQPEQNLPLQPHTGIHTCKFIYHR